MDVDNELHGLGFSKKEVGVYLTLAELGKAQAQFIAKRAGISRTTVYPILYKFVDLGLVSLEKKQDSSYFVANPPIALLQMILREREQVEKREDKVKDLVKALTPLFQSKHFNVPKFQFFDGGENVDSMLIQYLMPWFESMRQYDNTLWGYQDHTFVENYGSWLDLYWKKKDDDHRIHLFSNSESIEEVIKGKISKRQIKSLGEGLDLGSTLWISGDFITLIMTRQQPHYAFQIQDKVFSANLRMIFSCLWAAL